MRRLTLAMTLLIGAITAVLATPRGRRALPRLAASVMPTVTDRKPVRGTAASRRPAKAAPRRRKTRKAQAPS